LGINCHPGKVNVVTETFNRRSHLSKLVVENMPFNLCEEFEKLNLRLKVNTGVVAMEVDSMLAQDIRKGQLEDEKL
jgi:hypothetical protein